jgi:hypothetical protein
LRAFEATLIVLELLELNYIIIDSKKWQHHFFGKDTTQIDLKETSKKLSLNILERYKGKISDEEYEDLNKNIVKHGDRRQFVNLLLC